MKTSDLVIYRWGLIKHLVGMTEILYREKEESFKDVASRVIIENFDGEEEKSV